MQSRVWVSLVLMVVGAVTGLANSGDARGHQDPKPAVRPPDGEALRRAQALSQTTPEHERLQKLAGKWQVTLRTFGPDDKVQEGQGAVVGQAMLGGRYLVLNMNAKMLGRAVEAVQIVGYDTLRKAYTSSWRDNASTWPTECHGGVGKDADVLTMTGTLHDAHSPNGRGFRVVFDLREKDRVTVKAFEDRGLDDVLLQEQVWQR